MGTFSAKDGTEISCKDLREGPVVTFSPRWPLNADSWVAATRPLPQADLQSRT